jgi:hypothetical protein
LLAGRRSRPGRRHRWPDDRASGAVPPGSPGGGAAE